MMHRKPGRLRIIGGYWRRRLIPVPDIPGVRPTHDRIRETLFNWLMPYIQGAHCLDLFAGSGILGFEALSRGAKHVSFVDKDTKVIYHLKNIAEKFELSAETIEIIQGTCLEAPLSLSFYPYDIIFLDPPFHDARLLELITWLNTNKYLAESALIYVEMKRQPQSAKFPGWCQLKEGHTMNISYYLLRRET